MSIVYQKRYLDHMLTPGHPESPERLRAIIAQLESEGLFDDVLEPTPATRDQLLRVHNSSYIDKLESFGDGWIDPDTYNREQTFDIASLAAGGGILAAKEAYSSGSTTFALLRPPGHHSGPGHSGGFCFMNNIAIAARELLTSLSRLAIVDFDVHHGNGTEEVFYDDDDVLYISTHQWGIFPGTGYYTSVGRGDGEGYTVDIPFHQGTGDSSFFAAFDTIVLPMLEQYGPDMLLVSIGGDAHYLDPLASLTLSSTGYLSLMERLYDFSDEYCDGCLAVFLEGGYDVRVLAEVITGSAALINGRDLSLRYTRVEDQTLFGQSVLDKVIDVQSDYWSL